MMQKKIWIALRGLLGLGLFAAALAFLVPPVSSDVNDRPDLFPRIVVAVLFFVGYLMARDFARRRQLAFNVGEVVIFLLVSLLVFYRVGLGP